MNGATAMPPGSPARGLFESKRSVFVALAAILIISLLVRLWRLGSIPTVFFHDECDNTVNAISILQGRGPGIFDLDWKPQPALAVNLIALSLRALGPSVTAIRLPSALFSVVALVPFFVLARRAAGPTAAIFSTLLLSLHLGYLHFSRSGWENVQVCLYTLLALEAVARIEEGKSVMWWCVAGLCAAVGAHTYFAGRAIIGFLGLYAPLLVVRRTGGRARVLAGVGLMLLSFVLAVAPLYPTLRANWNLFNQRTRAVLISENLPPNVGRAQVARRLFESGVRSAEAFASGRANHQPPDRYFPGGRPFLDWICNGLLLVGMAASLSRLRTTMLWWLALLVPFLLTQMLTTGSPNLARGIALLPIVYLFIALGMGTLEDLLPRWRLVVQAALAVAVLVSAETNLRAYFNWAGGPELAIPLQPAVQLADFERWWNLQNVWVREQRGFLNVGEWLAYYAVERGVPWRTIPRNAWPRPSGMIYRGSTTTQPYEINVGSISLTRGVLEVEVFAVPGADSVYDYVDVVGSDGGRKRIEAEDPRFTVGDRPVVVDLQDNHWWLQNYEPFSEGWGLVARKSERPPPLITTIALHPGTFEVHVGSFTGDSVNGVFAIQVNMHEAGARADTASQRGLSNVEEWVAEHPSAPDAAQPAVPEAHAWRTLPETSWPRPSGMIYRGSTTSQPYEINVGSISLTRGVLEVEVFAAPGSDGVYDYVEVVGADGSRVRIEAEDPRFTVGDRPVLEDLPDNHWWLQNYEPFSEGWGLVARKSERPPPLITTIALHPGTFEVHVGSFTGDPDNGVFAIQVNMHEAGRPEAPPQSRVH